MNKYLLFVVAIILLLTSCNSTANKPDYSSMQISDLFNHFIATEDSVEENKLIPLLNDSIEKYSYSYFCPIEIIDSVKNELVFSFYFEQYLDWDIKIKRRNVFQFQIDHNNQLTANKKRISSPKEVEKAMLIFLQNVTNHDTLPEKRIKIIELLDTVFVCKAGFTVNSESTSDSNNTQAKWKLIKTTISTIKKAIHTVRDQSASLYFQKKFSKLSLKEQEAISELHPIWIWYHPNRSFGNKPPPPSSIRIQEILNILDNEEEDLELE